MSCLSEKQEAWLDFFFCVCVCELSIYSHSCVFLLLHRWPVWTHAGGVQQPARSPGLARPAHQTHTHSGGTHTQDSVRLPHSEDAHTLFSYPGLLYPFYWPNQLSFCRPPSAALPPCHSLQTLRVSRGEHRTRLPHPTSPLVLWQQPNVGAPGAAKHPQTLEPELPPPCASTPALGCSLPEGGAVHWFHKISKQTNKTAAWRHVWLENRCIGRYDSYPVYFLIQKSDFMCLHVHVTNPIWAPCVGKNWSLETV